MRIRGVVEHDRESGGRLDDPGLLDRDSVNVIDAHANSLGPGPWWPGRNYVDWVGIDGYYRKASWRFAALFGPTIKVVRTLTSDPILISETGAATCAGKAAKIANRFSAVRNYGLLGLVDRQHGGYRCLPPGGQDDLDR